MGYWLRMPGECGERLSDSVAPEHLRGSCQLSSVTVRRVAKRGRPKSILSQPQLDTPEGVAAGGPKGILA